MYRYYDGSMVKGSGRLTPDQQLRLLRRVWGDDADTGGYVFLPWIPGWTKDKEDRRRNWNEGPAFEWPRQAHDVLEHLKAHQRDDLYFSVHKFLKPSRIVQHVGETTVLYADLDEVDPRSDIDPDMRPTIAWESSPGRFQGVWLMSEMRWDASAQGGINHRLSSAIGADPSGWDTTQVLRVPGKSNYKFDYKDEETGAPAPGRLLWFSDKQFSWQFMEERLPPVKTYDSGVDVEEHDLEGIDRFSVWSRVRLKCSHTVRAYMAMRSREVDGSGHDRSEVLWQIERDLADAGCSVTEIIAVVRGTPWNKYAGRKNELAQLRAEAIKAVGVSVEEMEEKTLEQAAYDGIRPKELPTIASLTEVPIPRPNWLVRKIWTKGSCGFISGEPKSYKSWFGLDLAISVATGTPFLNDPQFSTGKPRKVIYVQEEDSLPLVLQRAGMIVEYKSPDRFWHGQLQVTPGDIGAGGDRRSGMKLDVIWTPPTPIDTLAMLVRVGFVASDPGWQGWLAEQCVEFDADLVVIDTLGTTIGDVDADKSGPLNDKVLKPLKAISEQTGVAIAVVHHNRKQTDPAKVRGGQSMLGSTALHAWVESALYVRKGEVMTGQPTRVYVERENKLDADLKFRVSVPTMYTAKGDDESTPGRQLWEPQVLIGWGDPDALTSEGEVEVPAVSAQLTKPQRTLLDHLKEYNSSLTMDEIVEREQRPRGTIRQLLNALDRVDAITGSHSEGWTVQ